MIQELRKYQLFQEKNNISILNLLHFIVYIAYIATVLNLDKIRINFSICVFLHSLNKLCLQILDMFSTLSITKSLVFFICSSINREWAHYRMTSELLAHWLPAGTRTPQLSVLQYCQTSDNSCNEPAGGCKLCVRALHLFLALVHSSLPRKFE